MLGGWFNERLDRPQSRWKSDMAAVKMGTLSSQDLGLEPDDRRRRKSALQVLSLK